MPNSDPNSPKLEGLEAVLELARDKSDASRETLMSAITDLFAGAGPTMSESERALSEDILRRLVEDVEVTVRQALAERLAGLASAPRLLVAKLAGDEIRVAMPILERSSILLDSDLVEVIQHKSMEHRLAIAMRDSVSRDVSESLVESGEENVVAALLQNKAASFHPATLSRLVDESETKAAYQGPLLERDELGPELAQRMYWWVSAALRTHILEHFDVDATVLDDAMEAAVHDAVGDEDAVAAAGNTSTGAIESLDDLLAMSDVSGNRLVALLQEGKITLFQARLGEQTGLSRSLLSKVLFEPGGEGLAIACRSVDMEANIFMAIYRLIFVALDDEPEREPGDLDRITSLYRSITPDLAREAVRNWRRNPNYLEAIKQVLDASAATGDTDADG
jgi:uncharacterized protein (DUF2336 family)